MKRYTLFFDEIAEADGGHVGGKIRVLGELTGRAAELKISVPYGFAVTTNAYHEQLHVHNLEQIIYELAERARKNSDERGVIAAQIREKIIAQPILPAIRRDIIEAYKKLGGDPVAVRSSATAEDLPTASFAGQQDSYLNIKGDDAVCDAVRACWASLFTERAITYRVEQNIPEEGVSIAVGVQILVDVRTAGVFFTLEPTTGNQDFIAIEAAFGLGERLVQGLVRPDRALIHKKTISAPSQGIVSFESGESGDCGSDNEMSISRDEAAEIAEAALRLEMAYGYAIDGEWAIDRSGKLFIVQVRPETVFSRSKKNIFKRFLVQGILPEPICSGLAVGRASVTGRVRIIEAYRADLVIGADDIIVTRMTQPDWLPALKKSAGIITDEGGRTCHAAIVSRELKIPALVGTKNGTKLLRDGDIITVVADGSLVGYVYPGAIAIEQQEIPFSAPPKSYPPLMLITGNPDQSLELAQLPVQGVGLARMEFIIATRLKEHPLYAIEKNSSLAYSMRLAHEIALLAAPFFPRPVIVRFSDFKSNEYRHLEGGERFEPIEENPMIGLRGASRYCAPQFREAFGLECAAIRYVREYYGLSNVHTMVPFVRTVDEARRVIEILDSESISPHHGIERWMMVELPSNVILLEDFVPLFDGFSIGSNDLTQLTLGVDRDSGILAGNYDERNPAVVALIKQGIQTARRFGKRIGICGQAPSDYPEIREMLIQEGISSISVTSDAFMIICSAGS